MKVLPFKRKDKPPSRNEMAAYRWFTRNWSQRMRELICPQFAKWDKK